MEYLQVKSHYEVPCRNECREIWFNSLRIFILVIFMETFERTAFFFDSKVYQRDMICSDDNICWSFSLKMCVYIRQMN